MKRKTRDGGAKRFRAVFFDIGNVLLHFEPGCMLRAFVKELGISPLKAARFLKARALFDPIERGRMGPDAIYGMFRRTWGFQGSFARFRLLWSDHFTLCRSTAAVLKAAARTHKVYLLSNTNQLHYDFIKERYAFPGHVHGAFLSHELGLRKPEPAIYRAALRGAGVGPRETVFIDDIPENVEAARKLGIEAILHPGPEGLKLRLTELGVLPLP